MYGSKIARKSVTNAFHDDQKSRTIHIVYILFRYEWMRNEQMA